MLENENDDDDDERFTSDDICPYRGFSRDLILFSLYDSLFVRSFFFSFIFV